MADERTINVPINVNDEIQDRTIRHMVFIERFKVGAARKIRKILNEEILPEITAKIRKRLERILERGTDLGPSTTVRLIELEREIQKLAQGMSVTLKKQIVDDIGQLTKDEMVWQNKAILDSLGFDLETVIPNPRVVAAIVKKTSFAGLVLDDWFDTLSRSTQKNVMVAVNRGIVEGETTDQIIRRIRGTRTLRFKDGVWETTRRQAEAVTRTTINHVSTQARMEYFKENEDIIKGVQWVATLDARTSTICAGLDGKVFKIDKGPRPPAHVNCRSTISPILKSAGQLGLKDLPEGTRASMNGQVPASITYGEWLKRQPLSIQEEVLGVGKAKLFNEGNLPIEKFTTSSLEPLSLDELRLLEEKAFDKAGL